VRGFNSLYKVEHEARGLPFERREQMRAVRSQILLSKLRTQMEAAAVSALPSSRIGQASAYALSRWEALTFDQTNLLHLRSLPIENRYPASGQTARISWPLAVDT
jgi:hypothetical protein